MNKITLPENVKYIIGRLEEAGYEAYAVGGCVRDSLLGRLPEDWDITTSAKPEEVKRVFRRTIDTGIQHGTVTVLMPAHKISGEEGSDSGEMTSEGAGDNQSNNKTGGGFVGYEVTTYRIDGEYLDGRHPSEVIFTPSLHEDLARRDFTINAMAVNDKTGVVDDFSGLQDMERRVIRAVGDPVQRFTEDALRMLRALRFSAQLDFEIDKHTYEAIKELAPNLMHVSKERINVELTKLLMSDHPEYIALVSDSGLSSYISEHFDDAFDVSNEQGAPYPDIRQWIPSGIPKKRYIRWGTFLRAVPEEAKLILKELKMDNDTINKARIISGLFNEDLPESIYEVRKTLSVIGYDTYYAFLDADECLSMQYSGEESARRLERIRATRKHVDAIRDAGDCISLSELQVTGKDLMDIGIPKGPQIGMVLHELLDEVLKVPSRNRKEVLLSLAGK
ncbi:CCA tRNA nucleotidyltransferase [Oribacterium sp. P6A1]|uniref:CCA tRNA nucleotidyltransferase n=1 Tax=Oribacterium sp. P6A1 TaxID=1410612 RepID=UPI00056252FD|nr:[cytidine(C)-cytidine(C)-adenosine (A)]-adding enzyme [Oribacterium sp. P6A1]